MTIPPGDIVNRIGKRLLKKKQTLAVAESVTAGSLQNAIASAEHARLFFQGGVTAYNLGQKTKLLHIDPICGEACNCVSATTVDEMAVGVAGLFGSDWSVAVTGYASPVPESGNKLFCFYAIAFRGKIRKRGRLSGKGTDPGEVQAHYTESVLKAVLGILR